MSKRVLDVLESFNLRLKDYSKVSCSNRVYNRGGEVHIYDISKIWRQQILGKGKRVFV